MSKIALIDQDPMQQEMLSNFISLHHPEIEIHNFTTGQAFLDANTYLKIDLLITELHLPDMDGLRIIQVIQDMGWTIPIIALASNDDDFRHIARQVGAVDTYQKPVDPDKLLSEVNRLLQLHQTSSLYNMTVEKILQIVSGDKQDCQLTLLSESQKGTVFFLGGELTHAMTLELQGEEALCEMLRWDLHQFATGPIRHDIPISIKTSLISILMNAAVEQDETGQDHSTTSKAYD